MLENLLTPFYNKDNIPIYIAIRVIVCILSSTLYVPTWLYVNQQHIKPNER